MSGVITEVKERHEKEKKNNEEIKDCIPNKTGELTSII